MRAARALTAAVLALVVSAGAAAGQANLRLSGEIDGELRDGERVVVRVRLEGRGVRQVRVVTIALETNGQPVERLVIEPQQVAIGLVGQELQSVFEDDPIQGAFFGLTASDARIEIRGRELRIVVPIRLRAEPPPGSRLTASAEAGTADLEPVALGEPAGERRPISLGTIVAAGVIALAAGAAIGGAVARRRSGTGPNVYASVKRRLETAEPSAGAEPAPGDAAAPPEASPPGGRAKPAARKPAARKPAAKKSASDEPAARKGAAKKAPARKAAAKKASAGAARPKRSATRARER